MISVLLVEPHDDTRELYASCLQFFGLQVHAVGRTDEACEFAHLADVIVTGLQVPGPFDGIELIRRLRQTEASQGSAIIALSTSADRVTRHKAIAAGCNIFLTKPCLPSDLVSEIRHVAMPRAGSKEMLKVKPNQGHARRGRGQKRAG